VEGCLPADAQQAAADLSGSVLVPIWICAAQLICPIARGILL
jgi:hypothetical protein